MRKTFLLLSSCVLFSAASHADVNCGEFTLTASNDGFMHINGVRPETQKVTFLKKNGDYDNIKMQWMVESKTPGIWYGMDYIKRNGNKRILNVQLLQANMDAPRTYGTFDCVKN